jgi:flavin reductase (DIM6/NTAB) family NADH-FMN oxidoreductase RutF/predicted enzyme related to lactoylglutathione lyase
LPGQVVLVTTLDEEGRPCVATKSWISMVAFGPPPIVMFGCNLGHATARNIRALGEFVINVPGADLAEICWALGSEETVPGAERLTRHGLTTTASQAVRPPRVAECRAHIECELDATKQWGQEVAIFGRIVAVSLDGRALHGEEPSRYDALAPFFFLEGGWTARMGRALRVAEATGGPSHILTIVAVADLERVARFYRDAFGWPTRVEVPVYVEFVLPDGRGLGLYRREAFARNTGQAPAAVQDGAITGTEIYLYCEDLDAAVARLESAGARKLSERAARDWGDEAAYYADPDGNVLVVAYPLPHSVGAREAGA